MTILLLVLIAVSIFLIWLAYSLGKQIGMNEKESIMYRDLIEREKTLEK